MGLPLLGWSSGIGYKDISWVSFCWVWRRCFFKSALQNLFEPTPRKISESWSPKPGFGGRALGLRV